MPPPPPFLIDLRGKGGADVDVSHRVSHLLAASMADKLSRREEAPVADAHYAHLPFGVLVQKPFHSLPVWTVPRGRHAGHSVRPTVQHSATRSPHLLQRILMKLGIRLRSHAVSLLQKWLEIDVVICSG